MKWCDEIIKWWESNDEIMTMIIKSWCDELTKELTEEHQQLNVSCKRSLGASLVFIEWIGDCIEFILYNHRNGVA